MEKLSKDFIEMLKRRSDPLIGESFKCQHCYRRALTPSQVAYVSHGEAYCKWCAGE